MAFKGFATSINFRSLSPRKIPKEIFYHQTKYFTIMPLVSTLRTPLDYLNTYGISKHSLWQ